jgi:hypothetical protein
MYYMYTDVCVCKVRYLICGKHLQKRKGKRSGHQLVTAGRGAEKSERREQQY